MSRTSLRIAKINFGAEAFVIHFSISIFLPIGLFFLFLLSLPTSLDAQDERKFMTGTYFEMESKILGQSREYIVNLPSSYAGDDFYINKKYPILILLDGQRLFHLVSAMVQNMSSAGIEQIPEMLVVGIIQQNRNEELVPASDQEESMNNDSRKFRRYLEEELIPELETKYRTNGCKILIGHSLAGHYAIESFLDTDRFNGYLAIDPSLWWDDQSLNRECERILNGRKMNHRSLYVSQSNNPFSKGIEGSRLGISIQRFRDILGQEANEGLRFKFDFFENEDHFSVPLISIYRGLSHLFEGYKYPLDLLESDYSTLSEHYQELSLRLGGDIAPPGKLLNQVGLYLTRNDALQQGIELLNLTSKYYHESFIPFNSLGEAYLLSGDNDQALKNFERSLALNQFNANARDQIAILKGN